MLIEKNILPMKVNKVYNYRRVKEYLNLLDDKNIEYIKIDREKKQSQVNKRDFKRLLKDFNYPANFKLLYSNGGFDLKIIYNN